MDTRYAIVGLEARRAHELQQRLRGTGVPAGVWPVPDVELERLHDDHVDIVLVSALGDPAGAVVTATRIAREFAVVLLAPPDDADLLRSAMHAGCRDVVDPRAELDRLKGLIEEVAVTRPPMASFGRVTAVFGCHGGVGTTTVATGLAWLLSRDPTRTVCAVDLDLYEGDLDGALGVHMPTTVHDLRGEHRGWDGPKVRGTVGRRKDGLYVLPLPPEGPGREPLEAEDIDEILPLLTRGLSDVVVDLGSALDPLREHVLQRADDVVIVASQDVMVLRAAVRRVPLFARLGLAEARTHVVLNRYDANRVPDADEIGRQLGLDVIATIASDWPAVRAAQDHGHAVVEEQRDDGPGFDLRVLAARLTGTPEPGRARWWQLRKRRWEGV